MILNHEGVVWARFKWTGEGYTGLGADYGILTGPGPDSKGASKFSEHYYRYELSGKELAGKLTALNYSRRYCLHAGQTFDAAELDGPGKDYGTLRITLRKKK